MHKITLVFKTSNPSVFNDLVRLALSLTFLLKTDEAEYTVELDEGLLAKTEDNGSDKDVQF